MSNNLPNKFIDELLRYLNRADAVNIGKTIALKNEKYKDIYFKEDNKRYLADKLEHSQNDIYVWTEVIEYYIIARNNLYNEEFTDGYESLTKSFKCLIDVIKDAKDENWQLPVLFTMSVDLRLLASLCDSRKRQKDFDDLPSENVEGARVEYEYAEKTAECLMVCFRNLCTDTRSESQVSKRWGMMHIVNQLFKIYFKINKINFSFKE